MDKRPASNDKARTQEKELLELQARLKPALRKARDRALAGSGEDRLALAARLRRLLKELDGK